MSAHKMPFAEAKHFVLKFGKYKTLPVTQRTLDAIATSEEGLKYLVWLRQTLHDDGCKDWQQATRDALDAYLDDVAIAKEVQNLGFSAKRDGPRGFGNFAANERAREYGM